MTERYFMSYSRQELYFAEALVIELQRAGLDIWFDLQQLEPGCQWELEIERGLEACTGVIVLVSRASLASPWVTNEWEHALKQGKPIFLALFEAADLTPFTLKNGREIRLDQLVEAAVAIVDARRNFRRTANRMAQVLRDAIHVRDPLPTPNALGISWHVPLAINGVVLSMIVVTLLMALASLIGFSVVPPLMVAGLLTTTWIGNRTLAFMQRRSYRETRAILFCASILTPIISLPAAIVVWMGTLLAFFAPDIHRYSPLGQGLEGRQRRARLRSFGKRKAAPRGIWNNLSVIYGRLPGVVKILLIFFGVLATLFFVVVLLSLNSRSSNSISPIPALMVSFALGPVIVVGTFMLRRRYNRLIDAGLDMADASGLTYRVIYSSADGELAEQLDKAMTKAGHTPMSAAYGSFASASRSAGRTAPAGQRPWYSNAAPITRPETREEKLADYTFILLTNNMTKNDVLTKINTQERLVFLVASPLDNPEDFRDFAQYQWVDIRRQTPDLLAALAEDLMIFGSSIVSHSFGTRQTPQSFDKLLVPPRVAGYLGLQYGGLYLTITATLIALASESNFISQFQVLFLLPSIFLTTWLTNRIVRREITVEALLNINIVTAIISYIVGMVVGLSQPLPPGYVRNTGTIFTSIATTGVSLVVSYFIGRGILRSIFAGWLPSYVPFSVPFPGFQRDRGLWMRNVFGCSVVGLVTLMFSASSVVLAADTSNAIGNSESVEVHPYLNLSIPNHWKNINQWDRTIIRAIPLKAVLMRFNTPVSASLARSFGSDPVETLDEPDGAAYTRIQSLALNDFDLLWEPLYRAVYVPEPLAGVGIGFSAWEVPEAIKASETDYGELLAEITDAEPGEAQMLDNGARLWQAARMDDTAPVSDIVALYDTPSVDFLLVLSGSTGLIEQEQTRMMSLVNNAAVVAAEPSPTPTLTPTPTTTPTHTPTNTSTPTLIPTLFPTFEPFAVVAANVIPGGEADNLVTFDGLAFRRPARWAYTTRITSGIAQWNTLVTSDIDNLLLDLQAWNSNLSLAWSAVYQTTFDTCVIGVYAYSDDDFAPPLSEFMDNFGDAPGFYSEVVEDRVLSADGPVKLRRLILDTDQPGYLSTREWIMSIESNPQDYVVWVIGDRYTVTSIVQSELDRWLESFAAVE